MKIVIIGDIHFFHRRTSPSRMVVEFRRWFKRYADTIHKADLLVINGDLWDSLVTINHPDFITVMMFLKAAFEELASHQVMVRVLKGTHTHDFDQSRVLSLLTQSIKDIDYRYIDVLMVEEYPHLGGSILYIPDEWSETTEETQDDVIRVLKDQGIEQVDAVMLHGIFPHQVPDIPGADTHDPEFYHRICRGYIVNSHHHVFNPKDRVLPPGSFSRLRHGEEEPKGGLYIERVKGGWRYRRLINEIAIPYITIPVDGSIEEAKTTIAQALATHHTEIHVRLQGHRDLIRSKALRTHLQSYAIDSLSFKDVAIEAPIDTIKLHTILQKRRISNALELVGATRDYLLSQENKNTDSLCATLKDTLES